MCHCWAFNAADTKEMGEIQPGGASDLSTGQNMHLAPAVQCCLLAAACLNALGPNCKLECCVAVVVQLVFGHS